jgi:DNA processing protein
MDLPRLRRLLHHFLDEWGNMKRRSLWGKEDIIGLSLFHSIHGPRLRAIISTYDSLDSFCRFGLSKPLFHDSITDIIAEIRDIGLRHIVLHEEQGIAISTFASEEYPQSLLHIEYPPSLLYIKGKLNNEIAIGIVGTRAPTPYGQRVGEYFSETLAHNGVCIVSGLAPGIDTIVHKSVIRNNGLTYAVIASGHEQISPRNARELSEEIIDSGGAIISEYSMNVKAKPPFFPRRNRIISGLSTSVLIVESGKKGGSMITAQFAFDQNRDVFVIPGSIYSPMSEGNHHLLLKDKGMIATNPHELLFHAKREPKKQNARHECNVEEHAILQYLGSEPKHIDEIVAYALISRSQIMSSLLTLQCRSIVKQLPGMNFIRLTNEFTLSKKA